MEKLVIRHAERKDARLMHELILGLATYERRPQDVTGSIENLLYWVFDRRICTFLIAEVDGEEAGYAIYYPVFGSFSARGMVHLEDIFLYERFRGRGLGRAFMAEVCRSVLEQGYSGMEWSSLDWNRPSIDFYLHLGAEMETGRVYLGFDEEQLKKVAGEIG